MSVCDCASSLPLIDGLSNGESAFSVPESRCATPPVTFVFPYVRLSSYLLSDFMCRF